ncbi:N-acetylneuraminate synthase [Candidatus Woesearchaeota archaeon CG10_big_fil_rev_8_21_14_0_10_44_13]|nr:MAG: N-acetylneuraminate synthase [Candidatus Woesearchaeota archaeon CG10_big_fil_rev_8_21_14_0_10_44_13]
MTHKTIKIGGKLVGEGQPVFIIGDIGINHQGDIKIAKKLIDVACLAEIDCVKFQKRNAKKMLTRAGLEKPYEGPHSFGKIYGEHRDALELSENDYKELKRYCDEKGIMMSASVWDEDSAEFINSLGVPCVKIGSGDMTNLPMLEKVAKFGKPIFLSTGMATMEEIEESVRHIEKWNKQIILLHCVSTYPSKFEELNLRAMESLKKFGYPVGYSGHELGIAISLAVAVMGACVVERHFTLDRTMKGGDHAASLEPEGLRKLVRDIRAWEKSLGSGKKAVLDSEKPIALKLRKSIASTRAIKKGTVITKEMLTTKSPGDGLAPKYYYTLPGKKAARDIPEDVTIKKEDIEW